MVGKSSVMSVTGIRTSLSCIDPGATDRSELVPVPQRLCLRQAIPGVPYPSIMTLRASTGGIDVGERIISQYESWKQTKKFEFRCVDEAHYRAAGRVQQLVEGSDSARSE
jgi:hypothetical protein